MSDVYGDFLTTVGERLPSGILTKEQFFDIVSNSYIGRTVYIHNPVTKQEVSGTIVNLKRILPEPGAMQSLKRDAGVPVVSINLTDGKKLELNKNDGLYKDSLYRICSDERCSIMGGLSRKRKTRGRRRKTKNNRKRKTYRKRK